MKKILTLFALMIMSLAAFSQTGPHADFLRDAKKYLEEGNYEGAKTYYEMYVELSGERDEAFERALANYNATPNIPYNKIWYTTTDGEAITPNKSDAFGATIKWNTYWNGKYIITFNGNVTSIGKDAFEGCKNLQSITIPNSVTEIGEGAFDGCYNISNFSGKFASADGRCLIVNGKLVAFAPAGVMQYSIPNSVTEIGDGAFSWCTSLQSITIPNNVTSIGNYAFLSCKSLQSITIPNSVTEIGEGAFFECESLQSITIPESVTSIGWMAFYGCRFLQSIYCKCTTPPTASIFDLSDNASGRKIYVPRESVNSYKSAKGWSNYADDIVGYDF